MSTKIKVEGGDIYGRWVVISEAKKRNGQRIFNCRCECRSMKKVALGDLRARKSTQCSDCANPKHGLSKHQIYRAWQGMKDRCCNENNLSHKSYGGRNIKVCDRWLSSFPDFLADMGERPTENHSVDRIDNNGNYEPSNCRWSTRTQQNNNQRTYKNNTSGVAGVCWDKRGRVWVARISLNGKKKHLGSFASKTEAIKARLTAQNSKIETLEMTA